jgi:anti-sigma B factor antagonist
MEITTKKLKDFQIFNVIGDFVDNEANELRHLILRNKVESSPKILINLENVSSINSYAISVLIWIWKWTGERNGNLYIIGSPKVADKIKIMNLGCVIKVFDTEKDFTSSVIDHKREHIQTTISHLGKYKILKIEEELDLLVDTQMLKNNLMSLIEGGYRYIIVDLSKIHYLYSEVLNVFIGISKQLRDQEGELCLQGLNDDLMFIVKHVGLDKIMTVSRKEKKEVYE